MPVLTAEDHAFYAENGYLVVREAVPAPLCEAVIEAIWNFLGMDRNDSEDWYRPPLKPGGMIEIYQHQALWNTRQHPRLHEVFSELRGTPELYVSIDRAGMKPPQHPAHPDYDHKGFIHWDIDTSKRPLVSDGIQGVLCLADTDADQGGFQCIPGFHKNLEAWIDAQPADRNPRAPDLSRLPEGMKPIPIPARQGDLVVWDARLAHGNGHNVSKKPRFSQYIAMAPATRLTDEIREHRIACWRDRRPPGNDVFPGDPREIEQKTQQTAELTPLGRKLLGLDRW